MSRTRSWIAAGVLVACTSLALVNPLSAHADPQANHADWVGTWHTAVTGPAAEGPSLDGFTDTTLRQVAHVSVGGDSVRLRFSNAYGDAPLTLGSVTVAPRGDDAAGTPDVEPDAVLPVTFNGRTSVTIPAGADWLSDPVDITVPDDSDLVVSTYLPGPTGPTTFHSLGFSTSFAAQGDATTDPGSAFAELDISYYFLAGIDVTADTDGAVVFFGDSITDGVFSTVDGNMRYPDQVADRLLERTDAAPCGVLNSGIGGNRLLADDLDYGDSAMSRFERDVLSRPGVRSVVLLEGINDIGAAQGDLEPDELIAVYRQFIARAHDAGIEVVGATLLPYEGAFYYNEAGEADRQAINEWIRTSGEFDAVVDFDAVMQDPEQPTRLLPAYDSGDNLHPNDAGFGAMADAVDLDTIC
ncbi:SGNH/GDSL hydrolase family protein [Saccharomonospora azurea]|uniref:SGNH/GDSL hydrolase family protein n=1 Tax=Saccharomonospora azurea TaxID=40988 RepID=UPI00240A2278|nr:SGNH/GDSL hydrolase family protein [Saccharomonospora azurea]